MTPLSSWPTGLVWFLVGSAAGLTRLPNVSPGGGAGSDVLVQVRRDVVAALGQAQASGVKKMEVEFPPTLGTRGVFDDVSSFEELDANRDWCVQLSVMAGVQQPEPSALWLIFADADEARLAKEAWPGRAFQRASVTTIADAVRACGGEPEEPMGTVANAARQKLLGDLGLGPKGTAGAELSQASLQLVVQPGNSGPVEDWLNLETLFYTSEAIPLVVVNGALDKLRSGYYPKLFFPKLVDCSRRFYQDFEALYYLRPLAAGAGWLFRVFPEPWQLARQGTEGLELIKTFDSRPTLAEAASTLRDATPP